MPRRINCHIGGNLAVIADFHFRDVDDRTIVIDKTVLADFDIFAVIAVERRIDPGVVRFAQKLFGDGL